MPAGDTAFEIGDIKKALFLLSYGEQVLLAQMPFIIAPQPLSEFASTVLGKVFGLFAPQLALRAKYLL